MDSSEISGFINQILQRIGSVEHEWSQWKSLVSINERTNDIWSAEEKSAEWICLGKLLCTKNILPLEVEEPVSIGSKKEPFHELNIKQNINFHQTPAEINIKGKRSWVIDSIGCHGFGNVPAKLAGNFHFVGRGTYLLQNIEIGKDWLRVHFPPDWSTDQKHIGLFLHINDIIEIDGIQKKITQWKNPDCAQLDSPFSPDVWSDWTANSNNTESVIKNIIVYPVWLTAHINPDDAAAEKSPFLTITNDGKIYYNISTISKYNEDVVLGGAVKITEKLSVDGPIEVDSIKIKNKEVIPNLNAELWNGFYPPKSGDIVSTTENQELRNKSFADNLNMNLNRITNVGQPIHNSDVATKEFVENWINGIQPKASVQAVSTCSLTNIANWKLDDKGIGYWESNNDILIGNDEVKKTFDGISLKNWDSVLIIQEDDESRQGIFTLTENNNKDGFILKRRNDFQPDISKNNFNGTYVWCQHGEINGRTSWVVSGLKEETWKEGMPVVFHRYFQANVSEREYGDGLHQSRNGQIELFADENTFCFEKGKFQFQKKGIKTQNDLDYNYFDIQAIDGLITSKNRVQLGDVFKLQLNYNPEHFIINAQHQLSLLHPQQSYRIDSGSFLEWTDSVRCTEDVEIENGLKFVYQEKAPKNFKVEFKVQKSSQTSSDNHGTKYWVQYWIAGLSKDKKLTTAIPSAVGFHELFSQIGDKWFVKISWDGKNEGGYRLWRIRSTRPITSLHERPNKEEQEIHFIDFPSQTQFCLDIIFPLSFQKLSWKDFHGELPKVNETKVIKGNFPTNKGESSFLLQTPFGIGTTKPSATTLEINEDIIQTQLNRPAIHIITQPIPGDRAQIVWETNKSNNVVVPYTLEWLFPTQQRSRISMGMKESVISLAGDKHNLWICPEGKNNNRKPLNSRDRLIVLEGGLQVDGRIATNSPDCFETEGTGIPGNPAVLRTGMQNGNFTKPIGNGVAFNWKGNDLEAVPIMDGTATGKVIPIKQFTIQHPTNQSKWLQHACLEGPSPDIYQRGTIEITEQEGSHEVQFPDYWHELAEPGTISVHLTAQNGPVLTWFRITGTSVWIHWKQIDLGNYGISYWIVGKRRDVSFNAEPNKQEINVHSFGPYSWSEIVDVAR